MGFWIFMTVSNLLMPALMILVGWIFLKHPPQTINWVYGYRTPMSTKNQETWDFAHQYCGRLWWRIGWIMLVPSVLVMLPLIGKGEKVIGTVGGIAMTIECVVVLAAIIPVEHALKKEFDKNGNRRGRADDEI